MIIDHPSSASTYNFITWFPENVIEDPAKIRFTVYVMKSAKFCERYLQKNHKARTYSMKSRAKGLKTDKNGRIDRSLNRTTARSQNSFIVRFNTSNRTSISFSKHITSHQFLEACNFHFISFQIYQLNRSHTRTTRISTRT